MSGKGRQLKTALIESNLSKCSTFLARVFCHHEIYCICLSIHLMIGTSRRSVGTTLWRGFMALHAGLQTVTAMFSQHSTKAKQNSPMSACTCSTNNKNEEQVLFICWLWIRKGEVWNNWPTLRLVIWFLLSCWQRFLLI